MVQRAKIVTPPAPFVDGYATPTLPQRAVHMRVSHCVGIAQEFEKPGHIREEGTAQDQTRCLIIHDGVPSRLLGS
jgi:hypothetical protein